MSGKNQLNLFLGDVKLGLRGVQVEQDPMLGKLSVLKLPLW